MCIFQCFLKLFLGTIDFSSGRIEEGKKMNSSSNNKFLMFTLLLLLPVSIEKISSLVVALFHNVVAYFLFVAVTVFHKCNPVTFICMDVSLADVFGWREVV